VSVGAHEPPAGQPGRGRGTSPATRRTALADLVAGLLEARRDVAGARFDDELAALERAGDVSAEAARLLRYWQRASVRAVVDHARLVLPPALTALDESDTEAQRAVEDDAASWTRANEDAASSTPRGSVPTGQPTSLEDHRRRLLVAGLTREAGAHD
jgi:hypothetical protein